MSLHEDLGRKGAKRSSWAKVHYRDLALKICRDHPEAEVEDLAEWFLEELQSQPEFLQSIAIYIMANVRASLGIARARPRDTGAMERDMIKGIAAKAATIVLMTMTMPNGKMLAKSNGTECIKAGGWLTRVGKKVGPAGIVGDRLTEEDLQALFKAKK